ncbi:hypothetical protein Poli38472_000167 [Pythium oligandrum]|uniref:Fe2OG dioxygenase domain-containing protein n=1 Tax=Pythium oligandrum TaxID=41045 RepID=A0A8K1CC71_PYTOL|nr:hypothetical protein Poli38472_000167 [Pythium oligandrum]|eukprot:TMW60125.1 hypothetical protein Poli38472_000167 [Pythium oligandrum]
MANDTLAKDVRSVPVLDIGALIACVNDAEVQSLADSPPFQTMIAQLQAAATEWGFFYIANHGVKDEELEVFQTSMREFFKLPKDVKKTLQRSATNSRGYFDAELTKNKLDWKEGFDYAGRQEDGALSVDSDIKRMGEDQNQWLDDETLPDFRTSMVEYFARMEHIARRLIMLFALALGEKATFLDQFFQTNGKAANSSFLRLNYYPVAPEPENVMGVHHHTDAGALTVLLQDDVVSSLQVFHRDSQQWYLIPPRKGTFVINIGDMLQVWSNDRFLAPLHRVLANGSSERFSMPFFYNPSYNANVEPLITSTSGEAFKTPHYKPISWYDFRLRRFEGDYADHGEEIQIAHFRVE